MFGTATKTGERAASWDSAPCGFQAGDANLRRYVGNDPTNNVDPDGKDLVRIAQAILDAHERKSDAYISDRIATHKMLEGPWKGQLKHWVLRHALATNERVGAVAVQEAATKAFEELGLSDIKPTKGDALKANITADDFSKLKERLGADLRQATTISSESSWAVELKSDWELKIYRDGDEYRAAVVHPTSSLAHAMDALELEVFRVSPNGAIAEHYLHRYVTDEESRAELKKLYDQGWVPEEEYKAIVGEK
jgi:hypothetical protein